MDSLFVTCPQGLEQSLVRELQGLGLAGARGTRGGVQIDCDGLEPVYRIALKSRLAHRLLLRLTRFEADDPEAVYRAVGVIDWSDHLALDGSLLVEAKLRDTRLGNPHFVALRVKDAIVDQFRERSGQRPSVDTRQPDLRLNLFVHRRQAELSLDLSGGGLRRAPVGVEAARWRGGLGAALLQLVQWRPPVQSLVVLGAGDVDLLLAAAQLSADVAPGLQLNDVGFERWLGHVPALWQRLCEQARADMRPPDMPRVHVWEERRDTLEAARRACRAAGIENLIDWQLGSAERHGVPDGEGCVVLPPSDAPGHQRATRMRHVEALLQRRFAGWRVASLALGQERERGARWQWRAEQELTVWRGQGRFELAVGAIDARSPVLATRDEPAPVIAFPDAPGEAAAPLINRLQKNLRHLGRWARRQGVSCYRLYDADLPEYAAAETVMFYVDVRAEVRTRQDLSTALASGKRIVVPYCVDGELELFLLEDMDELELGMYRILEPKQELRTVIEKRVEVDELDLIMVPGVAFDARGARTGHGKGYYDKLLEHARPDTPLVALAFECQMFDEIPVEEHDVFMDKVVTEKAVYEGRGRTRCE